MKKNNIYIILGVILIILGVYFIYFKYLKSINVTGVSSKTCDYKPKLYYEKDNRKIYSYCLDNIEIKSGISYLELSKYLENHLIEDFVNLLSEGSSYDDGGSTIYRDGGTKKITKNNLNILVCHTEGNRDVYIGNKEMYYKAKSAHYNYVRQNIRNHLQSHKIRIYKPENRMPECPYYALQYRSRKKSMTCI